MELMMMAMQAQGGPGGMGMGGPGIGGPMGPGGMPF